MKRLLWTNIAPGADLHAAFIDIRAAKGYAMARHCHDFYELIFVLSGYATHDISGVECVLEPNVLALVRPNDAHLIRVARGAHLQYANIAFRADLWRGFTELGQFCQLEDYAIPRCHVNAESGTTRRCFEALLEPRAQTRAGLLRLLAEAAPLLTGESSVFPDQTLVHAPLWLQSACAAMRGDNLRGGVPRLVELSNASAGHVSRTLKAYSGLSPSEWVLERKLERAAVLLASTQSSVGQIAYDSGFSNLSYFYRTFAQRYRLAPRTFRLKAQHTITAHS